MERGPAQVVLSQAWWDDVSEWFWSGRCAGDTAIDKGSRTGSLGHGLGSGK